MGQTLTIGGIVLRIGGHDFYRGWGVIGFPARVGQAITFVVDGTWQQDPDWEFDRFEWTIWPDNTQYPWPDPPAWNYGTDDSCTFDFPWVPWGGYHITVNEYASYQGGFPQPIDAAVVDVYCPEPSEPPLRVPSCPDLRIDVPARWERAEPAPGFSRSTRRLLLLLPPVPYRATADCSRC